MKNKTTELYKANYKILSLFLVLFLIFLNSTVSAKNISQLSQLKAKIKEQNNTIELLKLKLQQCQGGALSSFDGPLKNSSQGTDYQHSSPLIKGQNDLKASQIDPLRIPENSSGRNSNQDDLISFP